METLTPSSFDGIWPFEKSDPCQMRESPTGARADPEILTHVFGAMVVLPPSAFATPVITGASTGVAPTTKTAGSLATVPSEFET
jgi:hypothetical protein